MIATMDDILEQVIDNDLFMLAQSEPKKVEKYEKLVSMKIFSYIDKEQFLTDDGSYIYPDDLKMVCILLLQSMYTFTIRDRGAMGIGPIKSKSRKYDDFTESYERVVDDSALSFFGIPIDKNSLAILDRYIPVADDFDVGYGLMNIDIH